MATIEYRAAPPLPCDIPKMKRAKLEDLAIDQMRQIVDLKNELMCIKNIAHRQVDDKHRLAAMLSEVRNLRQPTPGNWPGEYVLPGWMNCRIDAVVKSASELRQASNPEVSGPPSGGSTAPRCSTAAEIAK